MNENDFWPSRYKVQATWTEPTRKFIIEQLSFSYPISVMEVGCGSSAVLKDFSLSNNKSIGIDLDFDILQYSKKINPNSSFINGNGFMLPIRNNFFDLSFCHYLLLWIDDPLSLLKEMVRVTKSEGWICCFAEPDYLSRIDSPFPMEKIGSYQNRALAEQGVSLQTGRNLPGWLSNLNLKNVHWGILGSHQEIIKSQIHTDSELETLRADLKSYLPHNEVSQLVEEVINVRKKGNQVLFIPTFYAYGQKI